MKKILFIFLTILLLTSPLTVSAHSGKTDSSGGHYDYSTGEYHYHHGYPAHQHINGLCPYKIDDININDYSYDEETYYTNSSEIFPIEEKTTEFNINNLYFKSGDTVFNITINKFLMILLISVSIWIIIYILSRLLIIGNVYKKRYNEYLPDCKNASFIIGSFVASWSTVVSFSYKEYVLGVIFFAIIFISTVKIWLNINDKLYDEHKKKLQNVNTITLI